MKIRKPAEARPSWRSRFLEIAREAQAGAAPGQRLIARFRQRPRISAAGRSRLLAAHS